MSLVLTEYMQQKMAVDLTQAAAGVAGILNGAKLGVFSNNILPTEKSVLGDLTQNVDANLVPQAITWGAAYRRAVGGIAIDAGLIQFQLALIANAGLLYGYFIVDSGGTHLLAADVFGTPASLVDTLSGVIVGAQVAFGGPDDGVATVLT